MKQVLQGLLSGLTDQRVGILLLTDAGAPQPTPAALRLDKELPLLSEHRPLRILQADHECPGGDTLCLIPWTQNFPQGHGGTLRTLTFDDAKARMRAGTAGGLLRREGRAHTPLASARRVGIGRWFQFRTFFLRTLVFGRTQPGPKTGPNHRSPAGHGFLRGSRGPPSQVLRHLTRSAASSRLPGLNWSSPISPTLAMARRGLSSGGGGGGVWKRPVPHNPRDGSDRTSEEPGHSGADRAIEIGCRCGTNSCPSCDKGTVTANLRKRSRHKGRAKGILHGQTCPALQGCGRLPGPTRMISLPETRQRFLAPTRADHSLDRSRWARPHRPVHREAIGIPSSSDTSGAHLDGSLATRTTSARTNGSPG